MFSITGLTSEEFDFVSETLNKHREEKEKQALIEAHDTWLRTVVNGTIDAIGLEETKHLVHAINFDLRRAQSSLDNI